MENFRLNRENETIKYEIGQLKLKYGEKQIDSDIQMIENKEK